LVTVFSPNFLFSRTIFYFPNQKACLVTQNGQKTKAVVRFQIIKEIENRPEVFFFFFFFNSLFFLFHLTAKPFLTREASKSLTSQKENLHKQSSFSPSFLPLNFFLQIPHLLLHAKTFFFGVCVCVRLSRSVRVQIFLFLSKSDLCLV
jgi:hypothetical protein